MKAEAQPQLLFKKVTTVARVFGDDESQWQRVKSHREDLPETVVVAVAEGAVEAADAAEETTIPLLLRRVVAVAAAEAEAAVVEAVGSRLQRRLQQDS